MTLNSPLATPRATLDKLAAWGITTRKSLGQHFLIDDGVVGRILRLAAFEQGERILEVGPGIGTLTEALLLKGAQVLALEKDERLLPLLEDIKQRYPLSFCYQGIDALDWSRSGAVTGCQGDGSCPSFWPTEPFKLVANLPYAVAATIVLDFFQNIQNMQSATVMVQKEVADRMSAKPGSKDYGAYTVKLQLIAQLQDSFQVSRTCFLPPPRVDSTVIRFDRRVDQIPQAEIPNTFMLIEAAFAQRRKTIRNSMRSQFALQGRDPGSVDSLLASTGISPSIRAETLSPQEFRALGKQYAATNSC